MAQGNQTGLTNHRVVFIYLLLFIFFNLFFGGGVIIQCTVPSPLTDHLGTQGRWSDD